MATNKITRDHHLWTRDTIKNVSGDVTLDLAGDLTLDATGDINIPANIGLTFGDDGEKIEGDGTDLTIASSGDISITPGGGDVTISSTTSADPYLRLQNNNADANGSTLNFYKSTVTSADDDTIGTISFMQNDDDTLSPTYHTFGSIVVQTADVSDGDCGGRMELKVASHNGTATTGLKLEDGDASGEVDINLGSGTDSITTVAGDLAINGNEITAGHLTINSSGDITLDADGAQVKIKDGGTSHFEFDCNNPYFQIFDDSNLNDYFRIRVDTNGKTTISTVDDDAALADLHIDADGYVEFGGCAVGFDLVTPTFNASDTDVDFTTGNKQFVTFDGNNITDLNLIFPKVSGNFVLLLKQDGTGSRTVTNYKVWDRNNTAAASGSATVKFPGGSNPDLSDDANHVDIISFFYDADNEIAYGVASLDFQF
tara:strand:+ start:17962 stop:19245 length:1284 start_codon:yes stop_codon:yes gene_type:complete